MKINSRRFELTLAKNGLTKTETANKCKMSCQNLCDVIRRGACEPRTAGKIARALGVTVEYLTQED